MTEMFQNCTLKELNISNFKTNNVKDMSKIFYKCEFLEQLNFFKF